jgi:hypothetical protein
MVNSLALKEKTMTCEDAPCCGCCDPMNDFISPELAEELLEADFDSDEYDCSDEEYDDSMDGDFDSAMASAGHGMDEDYNHYDYGDEMY